MNERMKLHQIDMIRSLLIERRIKAMASDVLFLNKVSYIHPERSEFLLKSEC